MAVPKPHGGPTADRDRDWNWSEQGGEQVDEMVEHGGWKQVARPTPGTTTPTATLRRNGAPTSCPTTSSSTAATGSSGAGSATP